MLENFAVWIDERAKTWIKEGRKRLPVETVPPVGWGIRGKLITGGGEDNNKVQLTKTFDQQMKAHTIMFDGMDNNVAGMPGIVITEAEILWSVNSVVVRRVISVQDGASITGIAQGVSVNVIDRSALGGVHVEYSVGITIAPGTRANIEQPPSLLPFGVLSSGAAVNYAVSVAAGGTVTWTVPPNCGAVSAYLTAHQPGVVLTDADFNVGMLVRGILARQFSLSGCNRWVPLPPGCSTIVLTNSTGTAIRASCQLGIDG